MSPARSKVVLRVRSTGRATRPTFKNSHEFAAGAARSEASDRLASVAREQGLQRGGVDAQREEPHGSVAHQEMHSADMIAAETVGIPERGMGGNVDVVGLHPRDAGARGFADQ